MGDSSKEEPAIEVEICSITALLPEDVVIIAELQREDDAKWTPVSEARFNEGTLSLPAAQWRSMRQPDLASVLVRIDVRSSILRIQHGTATISLAELISQPSHQLLIQDAIGNPTYSGSPLVPCEVTIAIVPTTLAPLGWSAPAPPPAAEEAPTYPRHIFLMTRGTRGDVQPFVALAKGMANTHGWLVTLCTELHWKQFVLAETATLRRGAVRFLPSGGDTAVEMSSWANRGAVHLNVEAWQTAMLGFSEWAFFNAMPTFVTQVGRCTRCEAGSPQTLDLLICSFTLTGVALLCSEVHAVPMASFCTQPGCIPTADPAADSRIFKMWGGLSWMNFCKNRMERNLFQATTLPNMRAAHGLPAIVDTWPTIFTQRVPVVIPMHPSTFTKPHDWGESIALTNFIFLRGLQSSRASAEQPRLESFVTSAKQAGRKLLLFTFSSMPISRAAMLRIVQRMLEHCQWPLAVLYVGSLPDEGGVDASLEAAAAALKEDGRFLEVADADFGSLFPRMDAFIVHGGLGTTVEALRNKKPTTVTGRFWGAVCADKGVGPPPTLVHHFEASCIEFANHALDPASEYARVAASLELGDAHDDGVDANVAHFEQLLSGGTLKPVVTKPPPLPMIKGFRGCLG